MKCDKNYNVPLFVEQELQKAVIKAFHFELAIVEIFKGQTVYELIHEGKNVIVFHPGVGAPLGVGLMEEIIALGGNKFISCGSGGVLDKNIAAGHILVPTSAIKDEGCLAVDMECSAFCAVAQYRNVVFGQMIYSGDDISCDEWNSRSEVDRRYIREALFWFSVEACLRL